MPESSGAEFLKMIESARNTLIITKADASADELEAVRVLQNFLATHRRPHTILAPGFETKLERMRSFVIGVNLANHELASYSHEVRDGKFYLRLTPRDGLIKKSDVEVGETEWRFDLVIMIGASETSELEPMYTEHQEFFDATPAIALTQNSTSNEPLAEAILRLTA